MSLACFGANRGVRLDVAELHVYLARLETVIFDQTTAVSVLTSYR